MEILPASPSATMLDADGRVAVDALCVSCSYNLRTLHCDSICPECAHPVIHSIQQYFLRFAPPAWVKGLARGLLLVLIALGGTIVAGPLMALGIGGSILAGGPTAMLAQPTSLIHTMAVVQFAVHGVLTSLVICGLLLLTRREPGPATRPDRDAARRVLRITCWLLPIPIVVTLVMALLMPPLPAIAAGVASPPPSAFFGPAFSTFVTLGYASGALSLVIYMAATLALLRHLSGLVRRIPRPGLVRFAQVEFWGLLPSTVLLACGYAVIAAAVLPMMGTLMAAAAATTTAPTTTAPIVTTTISSGGMVSVVEVRSTATPTTAATMPPGSQPAGLTLQSLGYATTGPSASMPATAPTTLPFSPPPAGFFVGMAIGGIGSGLGGCGTAGFGVAGIVLLIMSCITFFHAAREAEQNAALMAATPPDTTSSSPPMPEKGS